MWKKKKEKPVRLEKKVTMAEKFQNWINRWSGILFIILFVLAIILFVILVMKFMPGTESGLWYNYRGV